MSRQQEHRYEEHLSALMEMEEEREGGNRELNSVGDMGSHNVSTVSSEILSATNSSARLRTDINDYLTEITDTEMLITNFQPYRVSEILPGRSWPKNLRELMNKPNGLSDEPSRKIPVTEMAALLCHSALIEVGFTPMNCNLDPFTICTMRDPDRVERLGRQVDPNGYGSGAGVFTWSYRVVHIISEDVSTASNWEGEGDDRVTQIDIRTDKVRSDTDTGIVSQPRSALLLINERNSSCNYLSKQKYVFSQPCTMITIACGSKIQIFCNFAGSSEAKPFQLKSLIDLQPFLETSVKDLEKLKLTPEAWMKCLNFNGSKFSSSFKCKFAALCLDAMNGVMFDLRGLVCLPPEILVNVFSYSDISSIRSARLTCKYLNEVASIPSLWRTLIRRDFGRNPSVPAARFARVFSRIPYELSPNIEDAPHDYRAIYEAQRRHSFRARFDLVGGLANRLGARHSWLPYVTPPRPYLFRVAYDVPQLPSIRNPANLFFQH